MNKILDHLITDDGEEENQHHENIRKMKEEAFCNRDEAEFNEGKIKPIQNFNSKKATGLGGISRDDFLRNCNNFH